MKSILFFLDKMSDELGETMSLLRSLPDFHLLQLIADKGRFIAGFGQAFTININKNELEF